MVQICAKWMVQICAKLMVQICSKSMVHICAKWMVQICATLMVQRNWVFATNSNFLIPSSLGWKDSVIRKSEFVANQFRCANQRLCTTSMYNVQSKYY